MIIERFPKSIAILRSCLPSSSGNLRFSTGETAPTMRLFARLSAISKSTRKCITIPRKTWSLPS